ncbi:MAG: hypothetical protein AB7U95_15175, partial [Reyranella sp.]
GSLDDGMFDPEQLEQSTILPLHDASLLPLPDRAFAFGTNTIPSPAKLGKRMKSASRHQCSALTSVFTTAEHTILNNDLS